ncbi:MAG TPA: glycosyltransferase family 39 protein [Thermoanaerobaculia bacterium]|nr:glycosyltransferase family 39 protein [Thermoanaerobaculia bacterium]
MTRRTYLIAVAALIAIAVIRVAATHRVFSATADEPIHLAAGYEWFHGVYTLDPTHPPLARILFALPMRNLPAPEQKNMIDRGNQLLYDGDHYEKNLARGRMGNLVFLILACVAVAAWAKHLYGEVVSLIAVALFSNAPPILGHAGLMTTDVSVAATLPLALYALELVIESASWKRTLFLGLALGLGVLSKLSFLVYFPVCAIVLIACGARLRRASVPQRRAGGPHYTIRALAVAVLVAFFIGWAGYRFEFKRPVDIEPQAPSFFEAVGVPPSLAMMKLPASSLPVGFVRVRLHDRLGHTAFLFGKTSRTGWWYYFPVVFFFKTPLPLLILFALGLRRAWPLALIAAAIMLIAMTASLNIGLRHILPIYAPFCIVAAVGVTQLKRILSIALVAWLLIEVALAHPDYMAWFNELAGRNPAHVAVDSNLDWGQDILRLARVVKQRRIEKLWVVMNNSTWLPMHGINAEGLPPNTKVSGWIAAGENWIAFTDEYDWLEAYRPAQRVGRSIRLYHIP